MHNTLVILTPGFPADEMDSTCLPFLQSFVKNLKRLNPSVHLIVLTFQYPFKTGTYHWHGAEVRSFNGQNRGKFNRLLLWTKIWNSLRKIHTENKMMGILNFWLGECALLGGYAAKKYHVRSFTWLQGQDARKGNRYFFFVKPKPESLIALSDFIADELFRNYQVKPAFIIPPGVDITTFPTRKPERFIDILGAGSLIPLKQYDQFIRVVARLAESRPGIRAVLCGDGPERGRLQQMISDLKINDNIELTGELDHEKLLTLMQCSKLFIHPSSYEGFATVCSESLYAGCQMVAHCMPMHHLFEHLHIVEAEDEMVNIAGGLLDSADLNHDPVLTYSIENACNKIMALYQ